MRIEEALYFANISQIKEMFKRIELFGNHHAHPTSNPVHSGNFHNLILHCKYITEMDPSASAVLAEMAVDYEKRGVRVRFVKLRKELKERLERTGMFTGAHSLKIFDSIDMAVCDLGYSSDV